jgi:flagellar motor switch protein FliG
MSMFSRYKRNPDGLRNLVELWESTPRERRESMIAAGMTEDPQYVNRVMQYMMSFEDILHLNESELSELLSASPSLTIAAAITKSPKDVRERFLRSALPQAMREIKERLGEQIELREVGGAQLKLVQIARKLEREGILKIKQIPAGGS